MKCSLFSALIFGVKFVRYPASIKYLCHRYNHIQNIIGYIESSFSLVSVSAPKIPYRLGPTLNNGKKNVSQHYDVTEVAITKADGQCWQKVLSLHHFNQFILEVKWMFEWKLKNSWNIGSWEWDGCKNGQCANMTPLSSAVARADAWQLNSVLKG